MGGAEAVEEVQERDTALDSGQVSHRGEVHNLLHGTGGQHSETGLAGAHHVGVVTEDGQSLGSQGTCGDVEDTGKKLTGNLVHIRDHQQEALGGGVGGGQGTSLQGTVHGTSGASLGLHFDNLHGLAEDVLSAACTPLVDVLSHRGRGRDRIDSGDFAEHIRHVGSSLVTVASHKFFFCHSFYI